MEDPQAKDKERHEAALEAALAPIFAKFLKEYKLLLSLGYNNPSPLFSLEDTQQTLEDRYHKIQKEFKDEALERFSLEPFDDVNARFEQLMLAWRLETARAQAKIIASTNVSQGELAREQARELLAQEGTDITGRSLSAMAGVILARKFKARRKLIAQHEVQSAYESTKYLKGQAIQESPELSETKTVVDIWNSVLDGNERLSHNEADGQERVSPEAFNVGGAELRFPGDPYGPLKEIINCRCFLTSRVIDK